MEDVIQERATAAGISSCHVDKRRKPSEIVSAVRAEGIIQVLIGTLFSTVFALRVVGHVDKSVFLWPVSAVALALALPSWHLGWKRRAALQLAAAIGFLIGADVVGMPWWLASILTLLQCLDIFIGRLILGPNIRSFDDLKRQSNILRFVTMTVTEPLLVGILGAYPVSHFLKQPVLQTAVMNVLANSLGFAVVVPAALLVRNKNYLDLRKLLPPYTMTISLPTAVFVLVSSLVFWQDKGPFLFMVFPPMVIVLLIMGLEGAVFTSLALSVIGWVGTSHGHGPICLMKGTPLEHLLALQAFVWVCLITALPIGALLDERRRAERSTEKALREKSLLAQELEASRHIFQSFIEHTPNVTFIKDSAGRYVFYNQEFAKLFGVDQTSWIGRTDHELFSQANADIYRAHDLLVMNTGQVKELIEQVPDTNGTLRSFKSIKFAYQDVHGRTMLAGAAVDMTDQIKREEELAAANRQLELLATTDVLTGLPNRRAFEARAEIEFSVAKRKRSPLSFVVIDIDNFKQRNDTYGHAAGDHALKVLGTVLKAGVRMGDFAARIGGEEFGILLPETDVEGAMDLANRIQSMLRLAAHGPLALTISVGLASLDSTTPTWEKLVSKADDAMYEAKHAGKDRVVNYNGHRAQLEKNEHTATAAF